MPISSGNENETLELITDSENLFSNIWWFHEWNSLDKNKIVRWLELRAQTIHISCRVVLNLIFMITCSLLWWLEIVNI